MKNIVFIAPPAAGKGTQSDLLVKKYNYIHISTGDLLREEVNKKSELSDIISERMKSGSPVEDEIVNKLLENTLVNLDQNFILDGYPRNIDQAKNLDELLTRIGKSIDVVLYLDMDIELSMQRALGRITCPKCNKSYNKYIDSLKPKSEGICDDCGSELICRVDDNEETYKNRYNTYINKTKPLLDYYKELGLLEIIDNSKTPEDTFKSIESVI